MAQVEVFATGNQIAIYQSLSMSGNSNGVKLTLRGVQTLGTSDDIFRIVIRQVNPGQTDFTNGQFVDIYAWPDTSPPSPPIFSSLNPQHDQFQGRASSSEHQIFTNPQKVLFDVNGITNGTVQYGPGLRPLRSEQLPFDKFPSQPPIVPCFTAGTTIDTARGPVAVEALRPGDLVVTLDHGLQALRWTGRRTVPAAGDLAPVTFAPLFPGGPRLRVSPLHRMLVSCWQAEVLFGAPEVLVAAEHLVGEAGVARAPGDSVTYVHLLFDRHEIVFAGGLASESFHPGTVGLSALDRVARAEVLGLFPILRTAPAARDTARRCLRRWEAYVLRAACTADGMSILSAMPPANRRSTAA